MHAKLSHLTRNAVDTPDEDNSAVSGSLDGRLDLSARSTLDLGVSHDESIIGKNDPLQFNGQLNGVTLTRTVSSEYAWDNKANFVKLATRIQAISNNTKIDVTTAKQKQDMERAEYNLTLQVGHHYPWGIAYLFGGPEKVTYDGSENILPEDRDSKGGRLGVGVEYQHGNLQTTARLLGFTQHFNAPTIDDVVSAVGTVQVNYRLDTHWTIGGQLERTFDETNIETSGGIFTNTAGLQAQYAPRADLAFQIAPVYRYYTIAGTPYKAESLTLTAGVGWHPYSPLEIRLDTNLSNQTVNDAYLANLQYGEQALTFSVILTL